MDIRQYDENQSFYTPFSGQVLVKAEEHGGKWLVYLQASNEGLDQDSEIIMARALHKAKDYYLSHGVLSWDHKHKILHDPGFIVGEPSEVEFTSRNETLVKGWLYQKNTIAQKLWENIQSGAQKLGASIGGGILQKAAGANGSGIANVIEQVIWDETAITHKPVNDATFGHVQMIPFEAFAKALMAGGGVDAGSFTGGRALTGESIDPDLTDATFGQVDGQIPIDYAEGRRYFDKLLIALKNEQITSINDVVSFTLDQGYDDSVATALIEFVARKIPNLR